MSNPTTKRKLRHQMIDVQSLQDLFDHAEIALKVTPLNEKMYKSTQYEQILNWFTQYPLYSFIERAFHIDLQPVKDKPGSVMIGIYDIRVGKLHQLLIEPLDQNTADTLTGRLMAIVTYVAIYFLTTYPESVGVYLIAPPKPFLSNHRLYGYEILTKGNDVPVMFATFDSLFERQKDFLFEMLLTGPELDFDQPDKGDRLC